MAKSRVHLNLKGLNKFVTSRNFKTENIRDVHDETKLLDGLSWFRKGLFLTIHPSKWPICQGPGLSCKWCCLDSRAGICIFYHMAKIPLETHLTVYGTLMLWMRWISVLETSGYLQIVFLNEENKKKDKRVPLGIYLYCHIFKHPYFLCCWFSDISGNCTTYSHQSSGQNCLSPSIQWPKSMWSAQGGVCGSIIWIGQRAPSTGPKYEYMG